MDGPSARASDGMIPRSWLVFLCACAMIGRGLAVLQRDIQYNSNGGCTYNGHFVRLYAEYVPVYNPNDNFGCVRVLCKAHSNTHNELAIHSCNPEYVNGKQADLWPGKRYPDCCKKLTY